MSLATGIVAPPTLDGYHLDGINPRDVEEIVDQVAGVVSLATGDRRWFGTSDGPGFPDLKEKRTFRLRYAHVREKRRLIEALMSVPGEHSFTLWKHDVVSWAGDGVRTEFLLPWRLAPWQLPTLPATLPPAEVAPLVAREPTFAEPLTVVEKTTAQYDAGGPAAEEVWFDTEGQRFKLATPPAVGVTVYASVVPLYPVFDARQETRRLERVRESKDLVLQER